MRRSKAMQEIYERRRRLHPPGYYSPFHPSHLYLLQRRERTLFRLLAQAGISSFKDQRILDVGCATGEWLLRFLAYGAQVHNVFGVELRGNLLQGIWERQPRMQIVNGDGAHLPFPDASFDLVHQATVFSSVLDSSVRRNIASEMLRVVRPDGVIVWFDMRYSNPKNPDIRGVGLRELRSLFPGCRMNLRSVSLLPALARRVAPWSYTLARMLEILTPLRIHYLAVIHPPGSSKRP